MARISYTQEELDHLEGCCRCIFEFDMCRDQYGADYFRHEAAMLREHGSFPQHEGMHPDDMDQPTAADMDEEADKIECGFVGGEELP